MAWAICGECRREVGWSARRGARLEDARCPHCGGPLQGKTVGRASLAKGRRYEHCVTCGRRGLAHLHPRAPWRRKWEPLEELRPAGLPVCWSCEPVTPCHLEGRPHLWTETIVHVACDRCHERFAPAVAAGEPCLCEDPDAWGHVCPVHQVVCRAERTDLVGGQP